MKNIALFIVLYIILCHKAIASPLSGLDLEVGREFSPSNSWYLLARKSWQVGHLDLLGYSPDLWLLPEAGIFVGQNLGFQGRLQVLLDSEMLTLGADLGEFDPDGDGVFEGRFRLFLRVGF